MSRRHEMVANANTSREQFADEPVESNDDDVGSDKHADAAPPCTTATANSTGKTLAGIIGNVLEWYDFAVFGFLSDVIGGVFFPAHQSGHLAITESFLIFGGAFLMRPLGGLFFGYIGDKYGREKALRISIFLMAFPTFAMGCLPSYENAGAASIVLLIIVRLLQGFSVGGQSHERKHWGYYGSLVMAAANFGTLLGSFMGWILRESLTDQQLYSWGWRLPFLSGIFVLIPGCYLRGDEEAEGLHLHSSHIQSASDMHDDSNHTPSKPEHINPIRIAFEPQNRRSLLASAMVPMLWSSGFYLSFIWMAIFMEDLSNNHIPSAFSINAVALFFSVCLLFPVAGILSDKYGRRRIMTVGAICMGLGAPLLIVVIGQGHAFLALTSQMIIGIALSCFGAPMVAWLVESFEPESRLTSVSIGYNLAQATVGGMTPALATFMVDSLGPASPGLILFGASLITILGLWWVASPLSHQKVPLGPEENSTARNSPSRSTPRRQQREDFSSVPATDAPDDIELI